MLEEACMDALAMDGQDRMLAMGDHDRVSEMDDRETLELCYFWLSLLIELGLVGLEKFVGFCGGVAEAFFAPAAAVMKVDFLPEPMKREILRRRDISWLREEYNRYADRGIHFVSRVHPDFPEKLQCIANRPFGLFYRGCLPDPDSVAMAVVGARSASPYGQEMARGMARDLAVAGVQIISGMALGIDGFAHRGALEAGAPTYGILGCGVNICYPKENIHIFEAMKTCGGIISEFPPDTRPLSWHFPFRNRLISGLSDGILVVEARKKSGSLITAGFGLDQGKEIFAVPGRPVDDLSAGCNSLIEDGAHLVTSASQILEEYGISVKLQRKNKIVLDKLENMVYSSLCLDAKSIGEIANELRLDYARTAGCLFALTKKGCARQVGKNQYIRKL